MDLRYARIPNDKDSELTLDQQFESLFEGTLQSGENSSFVYEPSDFVKEYWMPDLL